MQNFDENEKCVKDIPLSEKYLLTISEANLYFNVGASKLRRMAESHLGEFSVMSGNRYLIVRTKFQEYMMEHPKM